MMLDIIKQFNWLDIFYIIVLFRIIYISLKSGLPVEVFKFFGALSAIYLSLHYYTAFSDFIIGRGMKNIPLEFLDFLAFIILAILGYLVFVVLREFFTHFIKVEAVPGLNKWGGLIVGVIRGILFTSLLSFILVISTVNYLKNSVGDSYFGRRLFKVAPLTYAGLWNGVMSKFMAKEKFNNTVLEVEDGFNTANETKPSL